MDSNNSLSVSTASQEASDDNADDLCKEKRWNSLASRNVLSHSSKRCTLLDSFSVNFLLLLIHTYISSRNRVPAKIHSDTSRVMSTTVYNKKGLKALMVERMALNHTVQSSIPCGV